MNVQEWLIAYEALEMEILKASSQDQAEAIAALAQTIVFLGKASIRLHRDAEKSAPKDHDGDQRVRQPAIVKRAPKKKIVEVPVNEEESTDDFEGNESSSRAGGKAVALLREWFNDQGVGAEVTTLDIAKVTSCSPAVASQRGKALEKAGVLTKIGRGKFRLVMIPAV